MKTTAKDFFLHIGAIGLLYAGTVAILNILFRVINHAFPQVSDYGYYVTYYGSSSISFPVATLIVVFPLFLFLVNVLRKSYAEDPSRKESALRRGLIYITLFIAGAVLVGDLITLIYFFLDGRELTTAFLLKILAVLVAAGVIFGYYLDDLKDRLAGLRIYLWCLVALVLVVGSIASGFAVIGTPQSQRELRYDSQRVSDLQNIQYQLVNYWQQKGDLPENLDELKDSLSYSDMPFDPQTKTTYEYLKKGNLSFELCAEFNKESTKNELGRVPYIEPMGKTPENWQHNAGRYCFERTIDPELYPYRGSSKPIIPPPPQAQTPTTNPSTQPVTPAPTSSSLPPIPPSTILVSSPKSGDRYCVGGQMTIRWQAPNDMQTVTVYLLTGGIDGEELASYPASYNSGGGQSNVSSAVWAIPSYMKASESYFIKVNGSYKGTWIVSNSAGPFAVATCG